MHTSTRLEILKTILGIIFVIGTTIATFWVLKPFLMSFTWALMTVIATWPLLDKFQHTFRCRRWVAISIMTLILVLLFVVPITWLANSVIENRPLLFDFINNAHLSYPSMEWLNKIPGVGEKAYQYWQSFAEGSTADIVNQLRPYLSRTAQWLVDKALSLGRLTMQLLIMVAFVVFLYIKGANMAVFTTKAARKLGDESGEEFLKLVIQAIRSVALGVVLTAIAQAFAAGLGLIVADVPYAMFLTIVMLVTCILQLGPLPILVPSIIWLYLQDSSLSATLLIFWSVFIASFDAILRPALMRSDRGLPGWLVFIGVIGGLISFGLIGIFIGPIVLAVAYKMLTVWLDEA